MIIITPWRQKDPKQRDLWRAVGSTVWGPTGWGRTGSRNEVRIMHSIHHMGDKRFMHYTHYIHYGHYMHLIRYMRYIHSTYYMHHTRYIHYIDSIRPIHSMHYILHIHYIHYILLNYMHRIHCLDVCVLCGRAFSSVRSLYKLSFARPC